MCHAELQQELAREEQASSESQIRHQLVRDRLEDSDRRRGTRPATQTPS